MNTTFIINDRQHASPHHEVATDVKQMPLRPIIIIIIIITFLIIIYKHNEGNKIIEAKGVWYIQHSL